MSSLFNIAISKPGISGNVDMSTLGAENSTDQLSSVNISDSSSMVTFIFRFDTMELNNSGPEVLAIKKFLKQNLTESENYSNVDSSDGPHFDAKMELAVKSYQTKNMTGILEILQSQEGHQSPHDAFAAQFGVVSRATLSHMHNGGTGGLSPLYYACENILEQALSISENQRARASSTEDNYASDALGVLGITPEQPDQTDDSLDFLGPSSQRISNNENPHELQDLVTDLTRPEPNLTPIPTPAGPGILDIFLRTRFTLENNPPNINTEQEKNSFFSSNEYKSLESEALQRVFAYFNKKPRFTLRNDAAGQGEARILEFDQGVITSQYPFMLEKDSNRDVSYNIIDPDSTNYLPSVERRFNSRQNGSLVREHENRSNLIAFHKLEPPKSPTSNWGIVFKISRAKMEAIITPPSQGREFNVLEAYEEGKRTYEQVKGIADKLGLTGGENFMVGFHNKIDDKVDGYQRRWNKAKTEFGRKSTKDQLTSIHNVIDKKFGINDAIRRENARNRLKRTEARINSDKFSRGVKFPDPNGEEKVYDLSGLKNRVTTVASQMREYHAEFVALSAKGKDLRFDPPVNLMVEADRLFGLYEGLTGFIRNRGHNPKKKHIAVTYKPTPDGKGILITKIDLVTKISDKDNKIENKDRKVLFNAEENNPNMSPFKRAPMNDRIAVGYMYGLNESYKELSGNRGLFPPPVEVPTVEVETASVGISEFLKSCKEMNHLGALMFVAKYRFPSSKTKASKALRRRPGESEFDIDTNIPGSLATSDEKLRKGIDKNIDKIASGNIFSFRNGKVFRIEDHFPLGELCNLPDLWQELLNKFKWQALICDMVACIPDLPPIPTDLDFDIPDLPDLSTFDPMKIIRPIIEAALMDLYKQFLCALVNAILDILKDPTCDDLYDLAARGLINLIDLIKDAVSERDLDAKITIIDSMRNIGIPPEAYASENGVGDTPNTVSSLFNEISDLLTVDQLCALLQGIPSQDTLDVIEIVINEDHPELAKYFYGTEDIKSLFVQLGSLIDPEICKRIIAAAEQSMAEKLCEENTAESLRKALEEKGTAKEEIQRAIDAVKEKAMARSEAFQALLNGNPLEKFAQGLNIPASPANEMPDFLKDMINNTVGSVSDSIRSSLRVDSQNYIEGLYDQLAVPMKQTDQGYNSYFAYRFYRAMAILAKLNEEKFLETSQNGKLDIIKIWTFREYLFSDNTAFVTVSQEAQDRDTFLEFPYPTPDGLDPKKYKIGELILDRDLTQNPPKVEKALGFVFKNKDELDIINIKKSDDRPFAKPISSGIVVGKKSKKPQKILIGAAYTFEMYQDNRGKNVKNRDYYIPFFAYPDSGISGTDDGGPGPGPGGGDFGGDNEPRFVTLDEVHGNITREIMADITEKMTEIQNDISNHVNVNLKTNFNSDLLPAIKSVFSVEDELRREKLIEDAQNSSEERNAFRESIDFQVDETGESMLFSIPDVGLGPIDNIIEYREIPSNNPENPDTYEIRVSDQNFTNQELIITGQDCVLPLSSNEVNFGMSPAEENAEARRVPLPNGMNQKKQQFAELAYQSFLHGIRLSMDPEDEDNITRINTLESLLAKTENGRSFKDILAEQRGHFYETLFEQIMSNFRKSNIFDNDYVRGLAARLLRNEYVEDGNCLVNAADVFGIDDLGKLIARRIQAEFKGPNFDPFKHDFGDPGPIEIGMIQGLSEFLIRVYVIEFALRSAITMTSFGNITILREESYIHMLSVYMRKNIRELIGEEIAEVVFDALKKASGQEGLLEALESIVSVQIDEIIEKINFIFGNDVLDMDMQNSFLETLESMFVLDTTENVHSGTKSIAPFSQFSTKEFKLLIGSDKPFFYLEKYFKYDGNNSISEEFENALSNKLTRQIIETTKDEIVVDDGAFVGPEQITAEQFRNFEGQAEADRIMGIVTQGDDIQNAIKKIQQKVDDAHPDVEFFSPKEIQGYFDDLVVDMDDEAEVIREGFEGEEIDDAASLSNEIAIKYIKRERVHIKVNGMYGRPDANSPDVDYDMRYCTGPSDRKRVLENWRQLAFNEPNVSASYNVLQDHVKESPRYYKIVTTIDDILEEIGITQNDVFFSKNSILNSTDREKIRKYYNMTNGLEKRGFNKSSTPFRYTGHDSHLRLGKIKYTTPGISGSVGLTKYYSQEDLDPETNPTVRVLTEEQFREETSEISDAEAALGISGKNHQIWTEFVFHVENFPIFEFGETFDPIEVMPSMTLAEFMAETGLSTNDGVGSAQRHGVSHDGTFYEINDEQLGDLLELEDKYTEECAKVFAYQDIRAFWDTKIQEFTARKARYEQEEDSADQVRLTQGVIDRFEGYKNGLGAAGRHFNADQMRQRAAQQRREARRQWCNENGLSNSVREKLSEIRTNNSGPGIRRTIDITLPGNDNNIKARYLTLNLSQFKNLIYEDIVLDDGKKISPKLIDLMADDFERKIPVHDFFAFGSPNDGRPLDFEADSDHELRVAAGLSRASAITGRRPGIGQRNMIRIPAKVMCRRIDYIHDAEIKDTQIFMNYYIPEVLVGVGTEANRQQRLDQKKEYLQTALKNICKRFKSDLYSGRVVEIDSLFQDAMDDWKLPEESRSNYRPAYFTIASLYSEAARVQDKASYSKFGTASNFPMTIPARVKYFDTMFKNNAPCLIKSPIRKGGQSNTIKYYDTYIPLKRLNEMIHPRYVPPQHIPNVPWDSAFHFAKYLNTDPTDIFSRVEPYTEGRDRVDRRSVTHDMFRLVIDYMTGVVDRRTLYGIYGKMSPSKWREFQFENNPRRKSIDEQKAKLEEIVPRFNIHWLSITNDGISSSKFHITSYSDISIHYASAENRITNHPFNGSTNEGKLRALLSSRRDFGTSENTSWAKFKIKEDPDSEFMRRNHMMMASQNFSNAWGINLAREFRVPIQIRNALHVRQLFTVRAIDKILRPESFSVSIKNLIRAAFYQAVVEDLKYGVRIIGVFNQEDSNEIKSLIGNGGTDSSADVSFNDVATETKSYMLTYIDIENNKHDRIAIPFAYYEERFGEECIDVSNLIESYEESFSYLKRKLSEQQNYKRLMSFIFPLERIFDVCMVYSMFVLSTKPEIADMMDITKSQILSNISMATMASNINYAQTDGTVVSNIVKACTPQLLEAMERGHGSDGFKLPTDMEDLGGLFKSFGKILLKQAKEFAVKVPRTLAQATDPAYRDMKRKVDSCQIDGITFKQFQPYTGRRELMQGVATRERTYAPISVAFPIDFYTSFVPFPPYVIDYKQLKSSLVKMTNSIINSGMLPPSAQLIRDLSGNCGPLGPATNSYGSFMTPMALLAMGVNELAGDIGKYKTQCPSPEGGIETIPVGPCDDPPVSEFQEGNGEDENPCAPDQPARERERADNSCDD